MSRAESKIYIDLDSIIDTRLGTIATLNQAVASELLKQGVYWNRETDDMQTLTSGGVSQDAYMELYQNRTVDVLKVSYITGIFAPLTKLIAENEVARSSGAINKEISFEINLYPYEMELEEIEAFTSLFKYRLGVDCKVTYCSVSPALLTAKYLTDNYAAAFMYHFTDWIKVNLKNILERKHPDFTLVAPKLFEKDVSSLSNDEKKDELTIFRLYMLEHMDISFIDTSCFSVFRPK